MGRGFSTFYRITLMAMSLTALILSALSATSCAFLKFDHQYGENSSSGSGGGGGGRKLPQSSAIPDANDEFTETLTTTTLPTIAWLPPDGSNNKTTTSESGTSTHASSPSSSLSTSANSPAAAPSAHHSSSTMPTHKSSHKNNNNSTSSSSSSSSSATSMTSTSSSSVAEAQITGEAGLFCDGQTSTFFSSLWGESSVSEFEDKIVSESNNDQSEEIARNAVVAALVIASITVLVMMLECIIGWRVWCDKVLVGLLAFMACISQGITFLFFDSERYCDGDLVNEIINSKPCVLGTGGVYSVVAVIMYAVMMIMACRLPQDDPYGVCCKKRRGSSSNELSATSGALGFGLVDGGKQESGSESDNNNDGEGGKRNWVSEENRRDVEENEII